MLSQNWIFKSFYKDLLILYVPTIIGIYISKHISEINNGLVYYFSLWLILGVLDSGHVYSTLWRSYFNKKEINRKPFFYKTIPLIIFSFFTTWVYLGGLYLGLFIIYMTIFHNIRQLYGISKWYQKINNSFDRFSDYFLYSFCILPFLAFHFRDTKILEDYYNLNSNTTPNINHFQITTALFLCLVFIYMLKEAVTFIKTQRLYMARIVSTLFPGLIYSYAFLFSNSLMEVLFPLVVSHAVTYIFIIDYSLKKINQNYTKKLFYLVLITAVFFGSAEFFTEDFLSDITNSAKAITTGFLLTPLFCHYLFDSFLWTRKHPETHKII